jgi:ABC-2 type transport system permease protein
VNDLSLAISQVRYTNKAFWRNSLSAFFTFVFPLMFLVIFTVLFGNDETCIGAVVGDRCTGQVVSLSTFYVASISAFSIITACYTNIAISITFARDAGVLKRIRGTPIPTWTYLAGRIAHAVFVAVLLVAICTAFGAMFYEAEVPTSTLPAFLLTLAVGAASFCALGLAISGPIPNADSAPAIVNASILPLLFISDVFIRLEDPPTWLEITSKLFPVKHFVDGMLASFFPVPGESSLRLGDLAIVALWGLAGVMVAARLFRWEPHR